MSAMTTRTRPTGPCSECGHTQWLWKPCDRTHLVTVWHGMPDTGEECPGSAKAPVKVDDPAAAAS